MKNYAQIEGRLGADAVTTDLQRNKRVTRFSVAINKTWKRNGQVHTSTEWIRVAAWNKLTGFASKLKKGHPVLVQGELRTRRFPDPKHPDVEHQTVEIVALSIRKFDYLEESAELEADPGEMQEEELAGVS